MSRRSTRGFNTNLQDLLVLLAVSMLHLLRGVDVVLEVGDSVLPCRQPLIEESSNLLMALSVVCGYRYV